MPLSRQGKEIMARAEELARSHSLRELELELELQQETLSAVSADSATVGIDTVKTTIAILQLVIALKKDMK